MANLANETTWHHGWMSSPDGRGTIDIVWGCVLTTFLCVWTVLTLNVPAQNTNVWAFTLTKLKWMAITLLGPEWLFGVAGGQWAYARRGVRQFTAAGIPWTMRQAFFADMGGVRVRLAGGDGISNNDYEFPVNSAHLLVLVNLGLVKLTEITPEAIDDRSKSDGVAKLVTIVQTVWFLLQCVARLVQRISMTTLELSTIAFVVVTIGTNVVWWSKPKDIFMPIVLKIDCTLVGLLNMVGPQVPNGAAEATNWKLSPLERFDDLRPSFFVDAWMVVNRWQPARSQSEERARFRNDRLPPLERDWLLNWLGFAVSLAFGGIYVSGWNIALPTPVETLMWRVCIAATLSLVVAYWIVDLVVEFLESKKVQAEKKPVPPVKLAISAFIAAIYITIRLYILIEPVVALRSLPQTAFQTVEWTGFIPHT